MMKIEATYEERECEDCGEEAIYLIDGVSHCEDCAIGYLQASGYCDDEDVWEVLAEACEASAIRERAQAGRR